MSDFMQDPDPRADVLAIGPFSPDIIDCLSPSADNCKSIQTGTEVKIILFAFCQDLDHSRLLASHLGVPDVWDRSQYPIDAREIFFGGLRVFVDYIDDSDDSDGLQLHLRDVDKFEKLLNYGFKFYFRPNGGTI